MLSSRSSANTSDHLQPPASPYPATVDPSPVDSNGTSGTDVHSSEQRTHSRADTTQIEDDAQVNQAGDEFTSPAMDDMVSPSSFASQESQPQVCFPVCL